ncbi:hypothetical protein IFM89_003541 [Coptis chinensis]|uniref:Uncharacterized protein n=1 Tax=Coptis chinensis TaxID=261450 RepID=A0A835ITZ8_9MAGN|nr:hypothetical protein IFM89_003541 [Coptis chinensis]
MSLSCLICQTSRKKEFDLEVRRDQHARSVAKLKSSCCIGLERNWSGGLSTPPRYKKIRNETSMLINKNVNVKKTHRRMVSLERDCAPRLVRSGGMRRDWSFEDLRHRRNGKKNCREGFFKISE